MKDAELNLPADVLAKAVVSGNEYGWRKGDVIHAVEAARSVGLAVLGGQVQFVVPGATCELYWKEYGPTQRKPGESWESFAARSVEETLVSLERVMKNDLVQEGVSNFSLLRKWQAEGMNLEDQLLFIVYFQAEEEAEPSG